MRAARALPANNHVALISSEQYLEPQIIAPSQQVYSSNSTIFFGHEHHPACSWEPQHPLQSLTQKKKKYRGGLCNFKHQNQESHS